MKKVMVVAVAVALACAAVAQASGWRLVSKARSSNSFYSSASLFKTGIKNVHGLSVWWAASGTATTSGSVTCMKGFNFDSYDYSFRGHYGSKVLRVPYSGGECSVIADATLENGGTVELRLYKR